MRSRISLRSVDTMIMSLAWRTLSREPRMETVFLRSGGMCGSVKSGNMMVVPVTDRMCCRFIFPAPCTTAWCCGEISSVMHTCTWFFTKKSSNQQGHSRKSSWTKIQLKLSSSGSCVASTNSLRTEKSKTYSQRSAKKVNEDLDSFLQGEHFRFTSFDDHNSGARATRSCAERNLHRVTRLQILNERRFHVREGLKAASYRQLEHHHQWHQILTGRSTRVSSFQTQEVKLQSVNTTTTNLWIWKLQ